MRSLQRIAGLIFVAMIGLPAAARGEPLWPAVRQVLDDRCVACHACYNAPCQLDLTAFEGLIRGATEQRVYDASRIVAAPPTRLNVDAHGEDQWRARGFFSVLEPLDGDSPAYSIFGRMLAMKKAFPDRKIEAEHSWMCPNSRVGMALYSTLNHDGMPFGFPALDNVSHTTLMRWLHAGARGFAPAVAGPDPPTAGQLRDWETFLNVADPRHRLVARYLYEHLFLAHLFVGAQPKRFYRLVRSATAAPAAVRELPTVRPYDDPGAAEFYYRFVPITSTLVHKTHVTFELSAKRLARYREWFVGSAWPDGSPATPGYDPVASADPFKTFAAIPAAARYRFMLDNARYFVMAFIRGPVCEGQMAVNVIDDRFHVLFLDPTHDLAVTDPTYLHDARELLRLPVGAEGNGFEAYYLTYKKHQSAYTKFRAQRYAQAFPAGMDMHGIWDGSQVDRDAALTVYRHFDNASVVQGLSGATPKTIWVMDYPIFERIYYLLVSGFNVFGNAFHQAATRLYMDNLRVESEDLFLSFLPPQERTSLRSHWYRGMLAELKMKQLAPLRAADHPTAVKFPAGPVKETFMSLAKKRLGAATSGVEIPGWGQPDATASSATSQAKRAARVDAVESALASLTGYPAPFIDVMPDIAYLLVDDGSRDTLFALIRNKAHLNVAFPLVESSRRVPAEDTLSVIKGVAGSYPNFLFAMTASEVPMFVQLLKTWDSQPQADETLFNVFGVSRYQSDFWSYFDRLNKAVFAHEGRDGARLDLSKYLYR